MTMGSPKGIRPRSGLGSTKKALTFGTTTKRRLCFFGCKWRRGAPPVYVKDPGEGQLLPLLPEDWLPWAPKDPLAGDFLETGNYGVRGAYGTRFYAQMKHALVYRKDFDAWLIKHLLYPSERSREKEAVKRAI